jgi:hypothetical protein
MSRMQLLKRTLKKKKKNKELISIKINVEAGRDLPLLILNGVFKPSSGYPRQKP